MSGGWAGKLLDIDLTARTASARNAMPLLRNTIGGRSLAARLAWDEIPPRTDACDPENRVIIATGPLTGTLAPTAGRTVMGSLSPRTYPRPWYAHSTLGGWFGAQLKYAGFDALVISGRADRPVVICIDDDHVAIEDAGDLWGQGARHVQLALKERLSQGTQVLAIGPAGEALVRFATVQHAEENAAGHSGFGAVWGSKGLKAIAVRGSGGVRVDDPGALLGEVAAAGTFQATPRSHVLTVRRGQTRERKPICSQSCTFDCYVNSYGRTRDGRLVPRVCIGGVWRPDGALEGTRYSGGGVEVPAAQSFSAEDEVELHQLCNDLGLDLWFRLVMQPWFTRCLQLGVQTIRGFRLAPGDLAWFEQFMRDLAARRGLGALFADDLRRAMDSLDGELSAELISLGRELEFNFGFPAHREGRFWDEEPLPFWVVSAMMHIGSTRDPTIGTHESCLLHADFYLADQAVARRQFRRLGEQVLGDPDAFEPTLDNKAPLAIWTQHQHMLIDSLPLCDFAFPQLVRSFECLEDWQEAEDIAGDLDLGRRLLQTVTGVDLTWDDLVRMAERAFTLERLMLARAGRGRPMEEALAGHFQLPCRADGTSVDAAGFNRLMDEYYAARGWDLELGWPLPETLQRLGLGEAVPELAALRQTALL